MNAIQALVEQLLVNLPDILFAVGVFIAALFLSGMAKRWAKRSVKDRIEEPETQELLARVVQWTVLVLGVLFSLQQIGVDVSSLLAGLGILGFTVGFALQDIARNFIAGLLLLMRKPFSVGDAVEIAGHAGSVMEITMRDTVIKTWDGVMEIVPNLDVFTNPIVNYSELPLRRRSVKIGLGYGEDVQRARNLFLDVIRGTDGVLDEPAPEILSEAFGDATLNMVARFWVNQQTHNLFGVHSDVVEGLNAAAEHEEIDMPYPIQVVQLEAELPFETPIS